MLEKVGERVSVNLIYNHVSGALIPQHIKWKNKLYKISQVGLHYTKFSGNTLLHFFSVCNGRLYFLLSLDTKTLHWKLEEVADELAN